MLSISLCVVSLSARVKTSISTIWITYSDASSTIRSVSVKRAQSIQIIQRYRDLLDTRCLRKIGLIDGSVEDLESTIYISVSLARLLRDTRANARVRVDSSTRYVTPPLTPRCLKDYMQDSSSPSLCKSFGGKRRSVREVVASLYELCTPRRTSARWSSRVPATYPARLRKPTEGTFFLSRNNERSGERC